MRQQDRAHRPGRGQLRVRRYRRLDQAGGGLLPLAGLVGGELVTGEGLHQAMHQHQAVPGQGD